MKKSASVKSKKQKVAKIHETIKEIKDGTEELLQQVKKPLSTVEILKKKVGNCTLVLNSSDNIFSVYAELEEITQSLRLAEAKLNACLDKLGDS